MGMEEIKNLHAMCLDSLIAMTLSIFFIAFNGSSAKFLSYLSGLLRFLSNSCLPVSHPFMQPPICLGPFYFTVISLHLDHVVLPIITNLRPQRKTYLFLQSNKHTKQQITNGPS